jgi:hypothetical protein
MSEVNPTPEELVEEISYQVEDATVIPFPIDPTLSIEGEAADAKAVGDALLNVAQNIKVNSKTADSTGNIIVYAGDILMSDAQGAQSIATVIESTEDRTGEDIYYKAGGDTSIAETVDEIIDAVTDGVTEEEIDSIFDDWGDDE